jgi:predicted MFS family arabinose efflux permease
MENEAKSTSVFSKYQVFIIVILAILQFTIVLDFMVLSPLGAQVMRILAITPSQFALVVSAYAFSAGAAGLLAAGFADKFDRKKLLLFFYSGFVIGTFLCGIAPSFHFLLFARVVTGIFGGVISSVSFAIITDLFKLDVRGRVMGVVQMAFAASQVMGIPIGLYLASKFDWHAPFLMIVVLAILLGIAIIKWMKPVDQHLLIKSDKNAFLHLKHTISNGFYIRGFLATVLLATGGFMLMPFSSAFLVNNVKITEEQLPLVFMITGVFSIITGPIIGRLSDKIGKFEMFVAGSILAMIMVVIYTNLTISPMWMVILINSILFAGISSRMISSSALMTAVPEPQDRGAFMGINSSIQQISGGIASVISGLIVKQERGVGPLENFDIVGYAVVASMIVCAAMLYNIDRHLKIKKPV